MTDLVPEDKYTDPEVVREQIKPGSLIAGTQQYIPWRVEDLDPNDTVEFIPELVPSLWMPHLSPNGLPLVSVDVNGLKAVYEVGTLTKTNKYFYNVYKNSYDQWVELEDLKHNGPTERRFFSKWHYGYGSFLDEDFTISFRDWFKLNWIILKEKMLVFINKLRREKNAKR